MRVDNPYGLGNRVAAMANGLSRAEKIVFPWRKNDHCPVDWGDLFPHGVPGVDFVPAPDPLFPTCWDRVSCESWYAAADRQRADSAYAAIMAAMIGRASPTAPRLAIVARFHRSPSQAVDSLVTAAIRAAAQTGERRVFIFCDRHRQPISDTLSAAGIIPVQPSCKELAADMQRTRADILAYAQDWTTVLSSRLIVALDGPASALHPARAAGLHIHYAPS